VLVPLLAACGEASQASQSYNPADSLKPSPVASPASSMLEGADVTVAFTSDCCGIAGALHSTLREWLKANKSVERTKDQPWGREGEVTTYVWLRPGVDVGQFIAEMADELPPDLGKKTSAGAVVIATPAGVVHRIERQKPH
jgi:hypothetical protein